MHRIVEALRQAVSFMTGGVEGTPAVVWIPDGKGGMIRHLCKNAEEMYQLQRRSIMDMPATVTRKGHMAVLDPTGHTEVTWDSDDEESIAVARETFNRMTAQGYQAFRPGPKEGTRGNRITAFDPEIESMILFPQLRGG